MTVLPATLDIKVAPFQVLFFDSKTHTADEDGLIRDVPYDTAIALINEPSHPAKLATEPAAEPVHTVEVVAAVVEEPEPEIAAEPSK